MWCSATLMITVIRSQPGIFAHLVWTVVPNSCQNSSLDLYFPANQNTMGQYKLNSWIWTIFSFVLHMMTCWSVLVMVSTVFDKTQARARKSIFCLKSYKNVVVNHLELIRDKLKILFGAENSGLKWNTYILHIDWKLQPSQNGLSKRIWVPLSALGYH